MPLGSTPNASRNLWYSTNIGNIHVTVISTEHDFLVGSDQYNWIQQVCLRAPHHSLSEHAR